MAKGSGRRHFPSGATGSCTVAWSEHRGTSRDPRQCSPLREHPSPPEPGAGLTQLSLGSVELLLSWSPALTQRLCGRPVTLWGPPLSLSQGTCWTQEKWRGVLDTQQVGVRWRDSSSDSPGKWRGWAGGQLGRPSGGTVNQGEPNIVTPEKGPGWVVEGLALFNN